MSPTERTRTAGHTTGRALLNDPLRNHGTAFTREQRNEFGLDGLLPYDVESMDEQLARVQAKFDLAETDLDKHVLLRSQQDSNEALFYAYLADHLTETLPLVYTPTVGQGCEQFSHIYRHPRGVFVSYPDRGRIDEILAGVDQVVRAAVVTDGERILGLGDQGIGGMGIPIGKLSLYTACAGIDPATTLPIILDVGTNNTDLHDDPLYMGWRHERIDGDDYLAFVDEFVEAFARRFPGALLQWEDFATRHARELLTRHRTRVLSFNDDIQGTAAVALAAIRSACSRAGASFVDQRFLFVGAGSAGTGIASMVVDALRDDGADDAGSHVALMDDIGVIHGGRSDLSDDQRFLALPSSMVADWGEDGADVETAVEHLRSTVLVGVSGQPGLFTETAVTSMLDWTEHPIILPLSNPTSRSEATPADLLAWTDGNAIVATGSPFEPVEHDGATIEIAQANNVYVFPGVALGLLAVGATEAVDEVFHAAAAAVAEAATASGAVLPPLDQITTVSRSVAIATAQACVDAGVADEADADTIADLVDDLIWSPTYSSAD